MKIRQSFVTNSSSSSFIVCFQDYDLLPKSADDVQKLLFGDAETHSVYDYVADTNKIAEIVWDDMHTMKPGWNRYNTCRELTKEEQLENEESKKPWVSYKTIDIWEVAQQLDRGYIDGAPELYYHRPGEPNISYGEDPTYAEKYRLEEKEEYTREDGSKYYCDKANYDLYEKDCRAWAFNKAEELFEKNPDGRFFVFHYGDNDGELGCIMEHGGIFDALGPENLIHISKH